MKPDYKRREAERKSRELEDQARERGVRSVVSAVGDIRAEIARSTAEQADQFRRRKDGWDKGATLGLWAAAAVGVWAIVSSKIDSEHQRAGNSPCIVR
jgi:hypothetical protein